MNAPRFSRNVQLERAERNAPPLQRGERGDAVRVLQQALIDLGFAMPRSRPRAGIDPDGVFGAETETAVKNFQRREGLRPDGIAGRLTLGRLDAIFLANDRFFGRPFQDDPRSLALLSPRDRSP
jgi:peptidoglycan hydrolase-like protein with peptidoglycan-binding domain